MFGIILWCVLIVVLVSLACPGFLTAIICIGIPVGAIVIFVTTWLRDKYSK